MAEINYRGDLEGVPVTHAAAMRVGVCLCGDMIGVDLVDRDGDTIAHGHLDIDSAEQFFRAYGEAIAEVRAAMQPV